MCFPNQCSDGVIAMIKSVCSDKLIEDAALFAYAAHAAVGQRRKYTGEPYIVHPVAVAKLVMSVPHTPVMVAVALLHDTVEGTQITLEQIRDVFGEEVASGVDWLTDVSRKEDGNRETRKALDRQHLAKAPAEFQTVKLADLIDNTESITRYDLDFARIYLREKAALLEVLRQGDATLWARAKEIADQGEVILRAW